MSTAMRFPVNTPKNQKGVSLIEAMVAALIFAAGLLGVLALQTKALQLNQAAYVYSQAVFHIQDISERMRANPGVAPAYRVAFGEPDGIAADLCTANPCTQAQLAQWDVATWKRTLQRTLPGGNGEIEEVAGQDNQYVVTVRFDDAQANEARSISVRVGL